MKTDMLVILQHHKWLKIMTWSTLDFDQARESSGLSKS